MTDTNAGAYDPYGDMIASNIERQRDIFREGWRLALRAPTFVAAQKILQAALDFHPMHAEDWSGWPAPTPADAAGGAL